MVHLTATSLTQQYRTIAKHYNDKFYTTIVRVTNPVTIQAFFPDEKVDNLSLLLNRKLKFKGQQVIKLGAGQGLIIVMSKSFDSTKPKKQVLYIYDPQLGWGKISGGYASKLVENAELQQSRIYDVLHDKKNNAKNQMKKMEDEAISLFKEIANKMPNNPEIIKLTSTVLRVEWEFNEVPRLDFEIYLNSWGSECSINFDTGSGYLYSFASGNEDGLTDYVDTVSKVAKLIKDEILKKYKPQLDKLQQEFIKLHKVTT